MRKYKFKAINKLRGSLFQITCFYIGIKAAFLVNHDFPYTRYFTGAIILLGGPITVCGLFFYLFGSYYVEEDGVSMKIGKMQIRKFKWKNMALIEIRRRWGTVNELIFVDKNNNGKRFGKEIEQHSVFLEEILDKAMAYGNVEIRELE